MKTHQKYMNPSERTNKETLKLGNATKQHSGHYSLEVFGSDGRLLTKTNVHLEIQGRLDLFTHLYLGFTFKNFLYRETDA